MNKDFYWYLEWSSTVLLILGAVLTSMQINYINILCSLLGNMGWAWSGIHMKKPSLWSVSVVLMIIYVGGFMI